jgi:5-oxoprolinase (ATP-hydrolysing) subunit A
MFIDLNSDLGESYGNYTMGNDSEVMKYISSANIACGFHAGDPLVINSTIKQALKNNVSIGAHPGYPDLAGFGRRSMSLTEDELRSMILYQVGALKTMTEALGGKLCHVKPHGALYNDLAFDYVKAKIVAEVIRTIDDKLIFVGLSNSEMIKAAKDVGLRVANEAFADRAYNDDGTLVSRSVEGAVITDKQKCLEQVHQMVKQNIVRSINGKPVPIIADTICVHGDNEHAIEFVKALNNYLLKQRIEIRSLKHQFL